MCINRTSERKQTDFDRAWHMPAMLGCSTVCPNCKHQFSCCASSSSSCVSPSVPLAFVLPPLFTPTPPAESCGRPESELLRLQDTVRALRLSGWYYEGCTFAKSDELLKNAKIGTFLVRNSSDPRYLFSLSMQTERGPKSVRLSYVDGLFRLDAQAHLKAAMPRFAGVLELVEFYVRLRRSGRGNKQVWVDPEGKWCETMNLERPLRKEGKPPALKHLARLAINSALQETSKLKLVQLELPTSLMAYLAEYPYSI